MAYREIRTETAGGGRTRVSIRREYYETPEERTNRIQKARERARKAAEVSRIAGIEVDSKTGKEYGNRKYDVPGIGELSYKTVELYANSQDIAAEHPEIQKSCAAIVEQVRAELTASHPGAKHDSFSGYVEELRDLYATAAPKRAELRKELQQAEIAWEQAKNSGLSEDALMRGRIAYLDAQEHYTGALEDLQAQTAESIAEIRTRFSDRVNEFYKPDGAKIDNDIVTLLNSGVRLRESEVLNLAKESRNNPTMLRLLGDYAEQHKIRTPEVLELYDRALSEGRRETETFDRVVDALNLSVGDSEVSATVWNPDNGLFDRVCSDAIQTFADSSVKPG